MIPKALGQIRGRVHYLSGRLGQLESKKNMVNGLKSRLLQHLEEIAFFMEAHGENPFKIRAFRGAIEALQGLEDQELAIQIKDGSLTNIKGIGKGIFSVAKAFLTTGSSPEWKESKGDFSDTIVELLEIRGLGPKKIKQLHDELHIKSLGELEYACTENRLVSLKGFGEKTQVKIIKEIQSAKARRGKHLVVDAIASTAPIEVELSKMMSIAPISDLGRKLEIVTNFEYLVGTDHPKKTLDQLSNLKFAKSFEKVDSNTVDIKTSGLAPIRFHLVSKKNEVVARIRGTSSAEHFKSLEVICQKKKISLDSPFASEEEFYSKLGLAYCTPEARELSISKLPKSGLISEVTGVFHLHTTYSDGLQSLEEMTAAAIDRKWSYMGLSDHSKTAAYAQGLDETVLKKQWAEVDALNKTNKAFKIYRGIESDILKDGSLDYSPTTLKQFDFVIASIHSRYGMSEMTDRLIKAIENEYTTMIGHLTGRLLLARDAYEIDFDKVIDAAISNRTVIELNSNPHRLDIDWRYLNRACEKGLIISINPDAHSVDGFDDTQFGIWMARKAYLSKESVLNTWSRDQVEKFLGI